MTWTAGATGEWVRHEGTLTGEGRVTGVTTRRCAAAAPRTPGRAPPAHAVPPGRQQRFLSSAGRRRSARTGPRQMGYAGPAARTLKILSPMRPQSPSPSAPSLSSLSCRRSHVTKSRGKAEFILWDACGPSVMIVPVLGQLVYVRTDLNYPCECAICTDPMTRRVETQEFIDNMLRASF